MKYPKALQCRVPVLLAFWLAVSLPSDLPATPKPIPEKLNHDYRQALKMLEKRKFDQAEMLLRNVIAADSLFREASGRSAWGLLGHALLEQNLIGESIDAYEHGYRLFFSAGISEPYLAYELAHALAQYQSDERKQEITSLYYDALEAVQPQIQADLWQTIYGQIDFLLSDAQKNAIADLLAKHEMPGAIVAAYFQNNDVAPFTAENEFLIAYLKRVYEARRQFFDEKAPALFDDRGKIYVRFGKPDRVVTDRSGEMGEVGWIMHPYEIWFYKRLGADFYFTFVGKSDNRDFRSVDGPESIFGRFYNSRRTMFGKKAARVGESAMALRDELYTSLAPWHETFRERLYRLGNMQSLREATDYASIYFKNEDREHARQLAEKAPAIVLDESGDTNTLPLALSHASFRENARIDRLELYYSVPFQSLFFDKANGQYKAHIRSRIAIFDAQFQLALADTIEQFLYEKKQRETERGHYLSQFNTSLPSGEYHVVVQVEDLFRRSKGFVRLPVVLKQIGDQQLAISDIQLSPHIQETQEKFEFAKNGVLVTPLPSGVHSKKKPLYLYYEIYNLEQNSLGESSFKIDYQLRALRPDSTLKKQHAITVSDTRTAAGANQSEYLAMDISRFEAGDAVLEIYVTDLLTNAVAFSEVKLVLEK